MKRILPLIFILIGFPLLAQDEDWSGDWGDEEGWAEEDSTWSDDSFGFETTEPTLTFSGEADAQVRVFPETQQDNWDESALMATPSLLLELKHQGPVTDLVFHAQLSEDILKNHPGQVIDEGYITYYGDLFDLTLGLKKLTWGKGDSLHVLDVVNGQDFSDFINGDELERKIAAPMIKADFPLGYWGELETLVVLGNTPHTLPLEGLWVQPQLAATVDMATALLTEQFYTLTYGSLLAVAEQKIIDEGTLTDPTDIQNALDAQKPTLQAQAQALAAQQAESAADELIDQVLSGENTALEDLQAGIRLTGVASGFDWGLQYYFGFDKEPVLPNLALVTSPSDLEGLTINYPRYHLAGVDAAAVLGGFNFRAEGAYTYYQDRDLVGKSDYWGAVAGFDRDLGISTLNLNIQYQGRYPTEGDTTQTVFTALRGTWLYDNLEVTLAGGMNIEDQDFLVFPQFSYKLSDSLHLEGSWKSFEGDDDTRFGAFDDRDFGQLMVKYYF